MRANVIPPCMLLQVLNGERVVALDKFEIFGIISTNVPRDVLPVVKVQSFLYLGLKIPRVLCIDGDEVLGIHFLRRILVQLLPVGCAGIYACLVWIFDEFPAIISVDGVAPPGAVGGDSADSC